MTRMEPYYRQHTELERLAQSLQDKIQTAQEHGGRADLVQVLNQLAGLLKTHLNREDNLLYPALAESPNTDVAETAKQFQQEMGQLATDFGEYFGRWRAFAIDADLDGFARETDLIVAALADRIDRENRELYPLLT